MDRKQKDVFDIEELEMNTCSAQDCTGLVPSSPTDVDSLEEYEDIYPQLNDSGI